MTGSSRLAHAVVVIALMASAGCGGFEVRRLADGRAVPESWATAPVTGPGQERATRPLRFDAVYVIEPFSYPTRYGAPFDPSRWEMSYYRFWPGGQVLQKFRIGREPDHSVPTAADADDFSGGNVGRYSVVGDQLTMAFVGFTESGPRWYTQRGRVRPDGSITIPTHGPELLVREHPVEGMMRFPDW